MYLMFLYHVVLVLTRDIGVIVNASYLVGYYNMVVIQPSLTPYIKQVIGVSILSIYTDWSWGNVKLIFCLA